MATVTATASTTVPSRAGARKPVPARALAPVAARSERVSHNPTPALGPSTRSFGRYTFLMAFHAVQIGPERIFLKHMEFSLALYLFRNAGRIVSREELWMLLWGSAALRNLRTIDTHISKLRSRLHLRNCEYCVIESIHGKGYRLCYFNDVPAHSMTASA